MWIGLEWPAKPSTVPGWKLVAYRTSPVVVLAIARPLYTAPLAELSTAITTGTPRNPEIVPSSLAKMKRAGLVPALLVTTKLVPPLNTRPVGALCPRAAPCPATLNPPAPRPTLQSVVRPGPLPDDRPRVGV